jgi:hypothetical protein
VRLRQNLKESRFTDLWKPDDSCLHRAEV